MTTKLADIEEQAARWVLRAEEADWSESEQVALDAWLDEADAHKIAYWRLQHGWREADRIGAIGATAKMPSIFRLAFIRTHLRPLLAIAASMALFAIIGALISAGLLSGLVADRQRPAAEPARFATAVGGRKTVGLPDGSRVELNTATAIRAGISDRKREIWLESGEAYFDVAKNPAKPFVVHAGSRVITVLGTKFAVRRTGSTVTVLVSEGRVQVAEARATPSGRSATIGAGDIAVAEGPTMLIAAKAPDRVQEQMAWREGKLLFDGETLREVASEFNRYNRKQLIRCSL